jgi:hypothetical protein
VGDSEGAALGLSEGDDDGLNETLGCPVGATLGTNEIEGDSEGAGVLNDGAKDTEGAEDGLREGLSDGVALGWSEGLSLG